MGARKPRLDRPLALERRVEQPDGGGGVVVTWTPVTNLWCEVHALSARAALTGVVIASRVSHRITARAVPEASRLHPRADDRLRQGGRVFLITGVAPGPGGAFLTIWAEETAE
jgi:head-tail adaptor